MLVNKRDRCEPCLPGFVFVIYFGKRPQADVLSNGALRVSAFSRLRWILCECLKKLPYNQTTSQMTTCVFT